MKKWFTIFLLFVTFFTLSALDGLSFELGPFEPLFSTGRADPYHNSSRLHYMYEFSTSHEGLSIMLENPGKPASDPERYFIFRIDDQEDSDYNRNLVMRLGEGISALRLNYKDAIKLNFTLSATINTVFCATHGVDLQGLDGVYFLGIEGTALNHIPFRIGFKHYSGHVGDEVYYYALKHLPPVSNKDLQYIPVSFTRDNMLELGLGYETDDDFSVALFVDLPKKVSWWDPVFHIPDNVVAGTKDPYSERVPKLWAVRGDYGSSYKAMIVQFDIEKVFHTKKNNAVYISGDAKFYQDGMTNHTLTPNDDTKQWDREFNILAAYELCNLKEKKLCFEVLYHSGRFPLLTSFWKTDSSISAGVSINR